MFVPKRRMQIGTGHCERWWWIHFFQAVDHHCIAACGYTPPQVERHGGAESSFSWEGWRGSWSHCVLSGSRVGDPSSPDGATHIQDGVFPPQLNSSGSALLKDRRLSYRNSKYSQLSTSFHLWNNAKIISANNSYRPKAVGIKPSAESTWTNKHWWQLSFLLSKLQGWLIHSYPTTAVLQAFYRDNHEKIADSHSSKKSPLYASAYICIMPLYHRQAQSLVSSGMFQKLQ